ncbi:MAG: hypothetical protein KDB27_36320, partial [Planctomycetales bacterium]|nr:hypothetical protein [Planctomycetales bacterium]
MTNFVQLSVLQLVRAIESTSSVLPIKRLCVSVICECDVHDAKPDCCPYTDDVATGQPLQLVLTVFDSMLLQLSVEPMVGQPHRDLLIRIVSDLREHGFSAPQTEWIPRLLDHICRHSAADVHDIVISNDVESGRHETLSRWARQIQAAGVDSGSIVSELDAGPFRSSALDYAVIAKARDLSFQSVVAQSHREAQAQSANRSTNSHSSSTPTPTARPSGDRQTCRYEETNTMAYPYYPTSYSAARGRTGFFEDPPPIGAAELHELQKHVVNLNGGRFSTDGSFTSSLASTRAIFRDHIPRWASGASPDGPVRVVLYAHGGLTNEAWGLHTAAKQLEWWKANGVYPVFFVWETGLWETLAQMFGDAAENLGLGGTRGWFDDLRQGIADGWDRLRDGTWESLT